MGRAFEFRKARKLKRWGNMARTFTRIGKQIDKIMSKLIASYEKQLGAKLR